MAKSTFSGPVKSLAGFISAGNAAVVSLTADTTLTVAAHAGNASGKVFISGASNDVITMNGSTKGGLAGSIVKVTAIASAKYAVEGIILGSGTIVTPFADA